MFTSISLLFSTKTKFSTLLCIFLSFHYKERHIRGKTCTRTWLLPEIRLKKSIQSFVSSTNQKIKTTLSLLLLTALGFTWGTRCRHALSQHRCSMKDHHWVVFSVFFHLITPTNTVYQRCDSLGVYISFLTSFSRYIPPRRSSWWNQICQSIWIWLHLLLVARYVLRLGTQVASRCKQTGIGSNPTAKKKKKSDLYCVGWLVRYGTRIPSAISMLHIVPLLSYSKQKTETKTCVRRCITLLLAVYGLDSKS